MGRRLPTVEGTPLLVRSANQRSSRISGVNQPGTDHQAAYHGGAARCRPALRRWAMLQARTARRVGCPQPTLPHVVLVLLGLLLMVPLAVASAHASGLGLAGTKPIVVDERVIDGHADVLMMSMKVESSKGQPVERNGTPTLLQHTPVGGVNSPGGGSPVMAWYRQA